jgi:hypothetical protein
MEFSTPEHYDPCRSIGVARSFGSIPRNNSRDTAGLPLKLLTHYVRNNLKGRHSRTYSTNMEWNVHRRARKLGVTQCQKGKANEEPSWNESRVQAERSRLCGVPCDGRMVAASAPMRRMRTHRLLRQFTEPTWLPSCRGDWPPYLR